MTSTIMSAVFQQVEKEAICKDALNIVSAFVDSMENYDEYIKETQCKPQFSCVLRELRNACIGIQQAEKTLEKILKDEAVVSVSIHYGKMIFDNIQEEKERLEQEWEDEMWAEANQDITDSDFDDAVRGNGFNGWFDGASCDI